MNNKPTDYRGPIKPHGALYFEDYGFLAGDEVRCIQSTYSEYEVGEVYELVRFKDYDAECFPDNNQLCLRYSGCNGLDGAFVLHRRPDMDLFKWADLNT